MRVSVKTSLITNLSATPVSGKVTQTISNLYHKKWGIPTLLLVLASAPLWSVALAVVYFFASLADRIVLARSPQEPLQPSVLEKEGVQLPKKEEEHLTEIEKERLLLLREHLPNVIVEGKFQNNHFESLTKEVGRLVKETFFTIKGKDKTAKAGQVLLRVVAAPLILVSLLLGAVAMPITVVIDKIRSLHFMKVHGGRVPHGIENLSNLRDVDFYIQGDVFGTVMTHVKESMRDLFVDLSNVDERVKKDLTKKALVIRDSLFFLSTASPELLNAKGQSLTLKQMESLGEALDAFEDIALLIDSHVDDDLLFNSSGMLATGWSVVADFMRTSFGEDHDRYLLPDQKRRRFFSNFWKTYQQSNEKLKRTVLPQIRVVKDEGKIPVQVVRVQNFDTSLTQPARRRMFQEQGAKLFSRLTEAETAVFAADSQKTPEAKEKAQKIMKEVTQELIEWMSQYDIFLSEYTGQLGSEKQGVKLKNFVRELGLSAGKKEVALVHSLSLQCIQMMMRLEGALNKVCSVEQEQTLGALTLSFAHLFTRLAKLSDDNAVYPDMEACQDGLLAKVFSEKGSGRALQTFLQHYSSTDPEDSSAPGAFFLSYFRKIWLAKQDEKAIAKLTSSTAYQADLHKDSMEGKKLIQKKESTRQLTESEKQMLQKQFEWDLCAEKLEERIHSLNERVEQEQKRFVEVVGAQKITVIKEDVVKDASVESGPPKIEGEGGEISPPRKEEKGFSKSVKALTVEEDLVLSSQHERAESKNLNFLVKQIAQETYQDSTQKEGSFTDHSFSPEAMLNQSQIQLGQRTQELAERVLPTDGKSDRIATPESLSSSDVGLTGSKYKKDWTTQGLSTAEKGLLLEESRQEEEAFLQRMFQKGFFSTDMSLYQNLQQTMQAHNQGPGGVSSGIAFLEQAKKQ